MIVRLMDRVAADTPHPDSGPLRVLIQQPSLAKYRVPVYRLLNQDPNLEVTVVYGQDGGLPNVPPDGFTAIHRPHRELGVGRRRPFVWQWQQVRLASREHCDVLVMVWNTRWLTLPLALWRARRQGVRTVLWGHGYSKDEAAWRAKLRTRIGRMADALLLYSRGVADRYRECGFDAADVFVAPNTLDQSAIQAARSDWLAEPQKLAAFREANGVKGTDQNLLYVSRFAPENRVDLLIRAVARLAPQRPQLRLNLIGKGEPCARDLKALAADLGIADRVRFLGAIYDESSLAPWFLSADVFCYPENIGLSLLHAMGYGVPVVTADDASIQNPEFEALRDGENGCTYRTGSAEALAEVLAALLDDDTERMRLGRAALNTATREFGLEAMVDGFRAAVVGEASETGAGGLQPKCDGRETRTGDAACI